MRAAATRQKGQRHVRRHNDTTMRPSSFRKLNLRQRSCNILIFLASIFSVSYAQSSSSSSTTATIKPMNCLKQASIKSRSIIHDNYATTRAVNQTNNPPPKIWKVGVLAIRGFDAAYEEFNETFSNYLTLAAGRLFDPPLVFEMVPLNFVSLFSFVETKEVDFIYVNPSAFSCIESEYGANSLVSQISRRIVGGQEYHLTKFGGVIFTHANRTDIQSLQDVRDQIVACASISGLGSGQMQFRELAQAGMSYLNDVKQMVFTSNQGKVVQGVLNGDFDVGFVRTDQLERTKDPTTGELIDKSLLKIINSKKDLQIDGKEFPFESSTPLYAEWNVAALTHVPDEVGKALQTALLQLDDHAVVGDILDTCLKNNNCTITGSNDFQSKKCYQDCANIIDPSTHRRCDTTSEVALSANYAKQQGRYAGWRSTLTYMQLRNMQEETGFISKDVDTGAYRCIRSKEIYDAIVCPDGHFRKTLSEVLTGCEEAGLECQDGYQCVCKPCIKAFDVDVFPLSTENKLSTALVVREEAEEEGNGCERFSLCGKVQQQNHITFQAVDNKKRQSLDLTITSWEGDVSFDSTATLVPGTNFTYEFVISTSGSLVGTKILQIFANGEQIPESPIRLQVDPPNCEDITGSTLSEPDIFGNCVCNESSSDIGGKCVAHKVLIPSIVLPILFLIGLGVFVYVGKKSKQADSVWSVKPEELCFDDPPEIIGRGTFGLVLLAEYRGTEVAVKRVIPPKSIEKRGSQATQCTVLEIFGEGDSNLSVLAEADNTVASISTENDSDGKHEKKMTKRTSSFTRIDGRRGSFFDFDSSSGHKRRSSFLQSGSSDSDGDRSKPFTRRRRSTANPSPRRGSIRSTSSSNHRRGSTQSTASPNLEDNGLVIPKGAIVHDATSKSDNHNFGMISGMMSGAMSGKFGTKSTMNFRANLQNRLAFRSTDDYANLKAEFIAEMRHLSKLRHPCITTVMGAVIDKQHEPMLVMEYMNHGSLYDILHNESMMLNGEFILPILRDVAQGIRFLHSAQPQCIHGDLKAQNVLVDEKFRAKVADFGLSQKRRVGATGTPLWMAPELLRGESENTAATDIYSLGIMLYEVYSRKDPYEGENHQHVLQLVMDPKVNKRPPIPPGCPTDIASMMMECVHANPDQRLTSVELDLRLKRLEVESVEVPSCDLSVRTRAQRLLLHQGHHHHHHRTMGRRSSKVARNEELVLECFPPHVADALRDGRKVEPDSRECVTVFFSHIVDFEELCSSMDIMKVSDLLNRLYAKCDELASQHGVFKIETIGDVYMAVTNLAQEQDTDHVKRMAQFAMDVVHVAAQTTLVDLDNPSKGVVSVRVGFHSGPIIANVVGTTTPKYTLFGDTVNVSSRMESNSESNRIQCSDRSASLLTQQWPDVPLTPRGSLHIKGKGEMNTFWVNEVVVEDDNTKDDDPQESVAVEVLSC